MAEVCTVVARKEYSGMVVTAVNTTDAEYIYSKQ